MVEVVIATEDVGGGVVMPPGPPEVVVTPPGIPELVDDKEVELADPED